MTDNTRKKNTRQRAHTTHGYGSMKKNRGAGNRGGRGNAGSGKRGDSKKQIYQKKKKYFGKHGFKKKGQKEDIKTINIYDLNLHIEKFVNNKKAHMEKDVYMIDLKNIGVNKLLGKGTAKNKYKIVVKYATAKAIEKIKSSGDIVIESVDNKNVDMERNNNQSA